MTFFGRTLALAVVAASLASCGGGGSDGGTFTTPQSGSLTLTVDRTTLPLNPSAELPFVASPFLATVNVSFRNSNGTLESPTGDTTFTMTNPNIATLSQPDDPATTDVNEFTQRYASFTETLNNGSGVVFVNSFVTAGTTTLTVSAVDPETSITVTKTVNFTVSGGVGPQPASITLNANPSSVYLPDSGASTTSTITAQVLDGAGQPVPNPTSGNSGVDNVQFEIVGDSNGAKLSANSAAGPVTGAVVTTQTINGIATVSFTPGTTQGPVQIKATADGADNNVSNGIAQAVAASTTVIVSDGKLYSLAITSPTTNAIQVNPVSANVTPTDGSTTTPPNPNGTYSLTVSALATDREGKPVLPGTPIEFGLVDSPITGFPSQGSGTFTIAGNDGNPQESGVNFTAQSGRFSDAGPGDTLLVFGDFVPGNRDLESARQIQSVSSNTLLSVTYPFNPNDDSGASRDYGSVLPYVIGHAEEGTIGATATTDELGVATTKLTYPVKRIGKGAYIWARAAGAVVAATGRPRLVSQISGGGFPGIAPGTLVVSQTPLPGNTSVNVTICLYDALGAPIQGAGIGFGITNLGLGTGSIDGTPTSGVLGSPTGADGCAAATLVTSGLSGGGAGGGTDAPTVTFTAGRDTPALPVPIAVSGNLLLQAAPSSLGSGGGSVTLLLTDANGNPVPSAQLSGTCSGGASLGSVLGSTDASGRTTASVSAGGIAPVCPGTAPNAGSCVFSTGLPGGPTTTVNVTGGLLPATDASCTMGGGGTTPPANTTVSLVIIRGTGTPDPVTVAATVSPAPGIQCNLAANAANAVCAGTYPIGSTIIGSATASAGNLTFTWGSACSGTGASSQPSLPLTGPATCSVTVTSP